MTLRPRQTGDDWRKMIRTIAGGKFTIGKAHWCYYWPSFEPINNVSLHYKLFLFFLLNEKKDFCSPVARKSCHIAIMQQIFPRCWAQQKEVQRQPICPCAPGPGLIHDGKLSFDKLPSTSDLDKTDWSWQIQFAKKHASEKMSGSPINI